jgi:hypothetical protein
MIYNIKKNFRELSNTNKSIKRIYLMANKIKVKSFSKMSDEKFAKLKYKENTGRNLDLEQPKTFNEKLWWLKLKNRDPLLTICSDKYKVRDYVKSCELEHILTNLYGIYENANDINFDELPDKVFIKCNHGSGANILYDRNKSFNIKKFREKFNYALQQNYYLQSREWNYKDIEPKIIVEEVLGEANESLVDYRFLCFEGEVKLLFIDIETASEDGSHNPFAKRNVYDKDFNCLDIKVVRENYDTSLILKPKNFDQMIEYAERLSKPFPFCRVDFYNIKGTIKFGEITFYPGGATQIIEPEIWELKLGEWIDLNSERIKLKDI